MQNLVVVSHRPTVCTHGPFLGDTQSRPLGWGRRNTLLPHVLSRQFWSLYVKLCGRRWVLQKFGDAGAQSLDTGGVAEPLERRSYPTCVILPNLVALGQTVLS